MTEEKINDQNDDTTESTPSAWKRYFLQLSYDGTNYHGWQRQPNSHSVQEEIEQSLRKLLRQERVVTVGCGRTDTGVHARDFYMHFNVENPEMNKHDILFKLNMMLPSDIGVYKLWQVRDRASARFDAIERSYEYHIHQQRDPFITRFSTFYPWPLNLEDMNEAAAIMLEYEDFSAFCKSGGGQKTTLCDLREARWIREDYKLVFHITANRFLRNMVRSVVGTLIEVGKGKMNLEQFREVIEGGKRTRAGESVAPQGLQLTKIIYPQERIEPIGEIVTVR
jgi:tRNA pseudouridine38-40 synthase